MQAAEIDLTFKRVRARDQTRLPCKFDANPFSGSRVISYTKRSQTKGAKSRTCRSSLRAIMARLTYMTLLRYRDRNYVALTA